MFGAKDYYKEKRNEGKECAPRKELNEPGAFTSHRRTVESVEPEASREPSLEKSSDDAQERCPKHSSCGLPVPKS